MSTIKIRTFGNSMLPFFANGDVLQIKKIGLKKIKVDDFITFKRKDNYITHRVVYKHPKNSFLITKGDANIKHDGKIYPRQIVGKVVAINRGKKQLDITNIYFLQSTLYFQEIIKIKNSLSGNEIDFLILKGLPIHLYFEKQFPSRIYADCDLLINKTQLILVDQIFKNLGYKKFSDQLDANLDNLKDKEVEITYKKIVNGVPVMFDVHLEAAFLMTQIGSLEALYPQNLLDSFTSFLLKNRRTITLNHEKFPILKNEPLIIYLALHLFHHNFQGYYRYELIKEILKTQNIDFNEITRTAREYRLGNFIYPVFLILKKFYAFSSPVVSRIKPEAKFLKHSIKNINYDIFSGENRIASGVKRFKNIFYLSEEPTYKKIGIFFSRSVLFSIYLTQIKRMRLLYFRYNFLFKQKFQKSF